MTNFEQVAFLCVTVGAGALLGLGAGECVGSVVRGAVVGGLVGPLVAFGGIVLYLYLGKFKRPEDW
jgi:hypothetical protein